ncbi:hypothetical protein GCM10009534_58270 [Kribbella sandramycini]
MPREGSGERVPYVTRPAAPLSDPPGSPPTLQPAEATFGGGNRRRALPVDGRFPRADTKVPEVTLRRTGTEP